MTIVRTRNVSECSVLDLCLVDIFVGVRQVAGAESFEWQKQLRYYWDSDVDNCVVRMSSSLYVYGYEYQGCSPRLVITPLTVNY